MNSFRNKFTEVYKPPFYYHNILIHFTKTECLFLFNMLGSVTVTILAGRELWQRTWMEFQGSNNHVDQTTISY